MSASLTEFIVVIAVAVAFLLIFGVKKIPEFAAALRDSKKILTEDKEVVANGH